MDYFSLLQPSDCSSQLDDFNRAFGPVVLPTDYDIATVWIVPMLFEVPAQEFKLDAYFLPTLTLSIDTPFRLAIWICRMDCLDNKPKLITKHAKKEDYSLFINRSMP